MANHASAEKRNRQRLVRTERNKTIKSRVRTAVKRARAAIAQGEQKSAAELVQRASVELARAASRGALHARTASRTTSRIQAALTKLGS